MSSSQQTILDEHYNEVLSPVVTITTPDQRRTLMVDDYSTKETSILKNTSLSISNGINKTGQLELKFRDQFGYYDSGAIYKGCRIKVKAKKKHQQDYVNLFSGVIVSDELEESTRRRNLYTITANSTRHLLTHTAVNYSRRIGFQNMKEGELNLMNDDPNFYIGNMIYDAMNDRSILINDNGMSLAERLKITLNGIDRSIPLTIPGLEYVGNADEFVSQFQELGGLQLGIDEDDDMFARYPIYKSAGHILTLDDRLGDDYDPSISMIALEPISRSTSIEPSNYAEVAIGKAFDNAVLVNNSAINNSLSLFNKDIGQQIDLRTTKLQHLTFILSKTGAGTNSADPENTNLVGYITTDYMNTVGQDIIAEFSIPLRYIKETARPINVNVKFKGTGEVDVTKKYWIIIQSIGDSEDNTVYWWNDGGKAKDQGAQTFAAIRDIPFGRGASKHFVPTGWRVIVNGPVFTHTFTTTTPILHIAKGITAKTNYQDPAPIEVIQSPSGVIDSKTMEQYLGLFIEYSSRIIIQYDFPKVSIPNNPMRVGYSLLYYDSFGRENQVNITDIDYEFTAGDGTPFGASSYKLSGIGYDISKEYSNINDVINQFYCVNR